MFREYGAIDSYNCSHVNRAYEKVELKEILFQGGLYGFTEPLQFESVEEALEIFNNNSQSRFYQLLKEPLQPEVISTHWLSLTAC